MKRSSLLALWGILYIICAGLGFIPEPAGSVRIFLLLISLLFFVPPAVLLLDAVQQGDVRTKRLIRCLSALSLAVTLALLVLNILSALGASVWGEIFHVLLVLCSAPMLCSNYWAVSLFLWAALLMGSFQKKED